MNKRDEEYQLWRAHGEPFIYWSDVWNAAWQAALASREAEMGEPPIGRDNYGNYILDKRNEKSQGNCSLGKA